MTIQEAIKSGKRFRRPPYKWLCSNGHQILFDEDLEARNVFYSYIEDILADDWEVEG